MENVTIEIELDPVQLEQVLGAHAETARELAALAARHLITREDLAALRRDHDAVCAELARLKADTEARFALIQRRLSTSMVFKPERATPWG